MRAKDARNKCSMHACKATCVSALAAEFTSDFTNIFARQIGMVDDDRPVN
jgi:hypothetical protein